MNCTFKKADSQRSDLPLSFVSYKCSRLGCGVVAYSPHGPEKIHSECRGWPLPHEYREWLALFSAVAGITQALAICQYIRWRAKGSKLEELPPGVPSPNVLPIPAPAEGPGTELKKLFEELGIEPKSSCQCRQRVEEMNRRGIAGCLRTKEEIIDWLREGYDEATVWQKSVAFALAVGKVLPLRLESLFYEAIRRSELLSPMTYRLPSSES